MQIEYHVVDVFTQTVLEGNALAVFPDASSLPEETLQKIAREFNLSETAFVFPATRKDCAARVRIFTPVHEMKFAGHPTVGTAFVMRQTGIVPMDLTAFALEENIGPVSVRVDGSDDPIIWLRTPPLKQESTYVRAACATALGLQETDLLPGVPCEIFSAGNPNLYVAVRDAERVDRASVDLAALRALNSPDGPVCMYVFAPAPQGAYARMFAPELGQERKRIRERHSSGLLHEDAVDRRKRCVMLQRRLQRVIAQREFARKVRLMQRAAPVEQRDEHCR